MSFIFERITPESFRDGRVRELSRFVAGRTTAIILALMKDGGYVALVTVGTDHDSRILSVRGATVFARERLGQFGYAVDAAAIAIGQRGD